MNEISYVGGANDRFALISPDENVGALNIERCVGNFRWDAIKLVPAMN